ncbi:MAG: helix-turn-helix domain-containing protein [Pseudoalteromonas prydzensis]|uniref:helix-turn-helix domain-containing protein n=1 Tax=Pseudoalteromonas prydzensis TaxID=182141 RepID=UPI003F9B5C33
MKTNDGSPFPKRLKEARLAKGLSQKKLGILADIDEFVASPRMNQYEKGVHSPDFQTVRALAKVLEVPTAFLFCEENELAELILTYKANN